MVRAMRRFVPFALLLTACSQEPSQPELAVGTFAGDGRDRLCIVGEPGAYQAGLITFGVGDNNCSAAGRLEVAGSGWALVPRGEGDCRIPLEVKDNVVRIGQPSASCDYYCGPGAKLAGKSYNRSDMGAKVTDLAGEPLC